MAAMSPKLSILLGLSKKYIYASLEEIKQMAQKRSFFSENFSHSSLLTLKIRSKLSALKVIKLIYMYLYTSLVKNLSTGLKDILHRTQSVSK